MLTGIVDYVVIGLIVALVGLAAWVVVLQIRLARLVKQYRHLMAGVDGTSLEESLNQHIDEVRHAVESLAELDTKTRRMDRTLKHSMQWMGVVRFNPFRNTGGDQSFAWAIVDGYGNGVVLSSLHSRENTRIYAKPLHKWESPYSLTEEEKQAIARAYQQQG
jgi:hypothetical protein